MELPARIAPRGDAHPARLGPYRVIERIGSGGQGFVYRARREDDEDGEDVAIKRLHPHLVDDERERRGFAREARIAYQLDHPVIRRVRALRRDGDELVLVMEYVDGISLKDVLKRTHAAGRRLPVAGSIAVLVRLCGALHYAHELVDEVDAPAGIIHRDVSPSNLIITARGHLKLIDLGIARSQAAQHATNSGLVKGKYGYMAPEVLEGGPFDRRADVYSTGVLAWELLTTRKLFAVSHPPLDLERVRSGAIAPPSRHNPACSPALDAVVMRALAVDPAERWATCAALADALCGIAAREGLLLGEGAIIELGDQPRVRIARGTGPAVDTSATAPLVPATAPAAAPASGARPSLPMRALTGVAALVVIALAVGLGLPIAPAGPTPAPRGTELVATAHAAAVRVATPPGPGSPPAAAIGAEVAEAPLVVAVDEVERLAGDAPRSRSSSARFRAHLCIGADGAVQSTRVLDGPPRLHARIARTLARWRYRPYRDRDGARAVCFEVTSRLQRPART